MARPTVMTTKLKHPKTAWLAAPDGQLVKVDLHKNRQRKLQLDIQYLVEEGTKIMTVVL